MFAEGLTKLSGNRRGRREPAGRAPPAPYRGATRAGAAGSGSNPPARWRRWLATARQPWQHMACVWPPMLTGRSTSPGIGGPQWKHEAWDMKAEKGAEAPSC